MAPPDNVARMYAWLERHPGAEWARPETPAGRHRVRWALPNGTVIDCDNIELGWLVDYIESVDRDNVTN